MHSFNILLIIVISEVSFGQVNIIVPENMHNGAGGINGEAIASWETNDRFENDALYMTGTGDMRNTNPSGYPGASGTWNVMLNSAGEYFMIQGIDASAYSNLQLSLGIRKSTLAEDGSGLSTECSIDGFSWTSLSISLPTGPGTAGWHLVQVVGSIPSTSSLYLRFTSLAITEFRLDDIQLKGMLPCSTAITSFLPTSGPPGTQVMINGSGFNGAVQVLFNGIAALSFQILSDGSITATAPSVPGTGPLTILTTCILSSAFPFEIIGSSCQFNGTNLILSELCDPTNNYETDRYIEIFNPTPTIIDLNGWSVRAIANFSECETWNLSGLIQPGEALTCGYTTPVNGGPHDFVLAEWNGNNIGSCCNHWNGNRRDGGALYQGFAKVDEGLFANDPTSWFSDRSLIRNDTICRPNPFENPMEWMVSGQVTVAGSSPSTPGMHATNCPGTVPNILDLPVSQQVCEGGDVSFFVSAVEGNAPFLFQWMVLDISGIWQEVTAISPYSVTSGASSCSLILTTIPSSFDQYQYYCRVTTMSGGCWTASSAAMLTVIPSPSTSGIFHY